MIRRLIACVAALAGALPFCAPAQETAPAAPATTTTQGAKVMVIPIREQIAKPEFYILRRGLKQAIDGKFDTVVLDMETPGGALDVTFDILQALEKFPGKTVTYVNREAISAGALISAGTDEIYFAPTAVIGAAAPVAAGGAEIDETMRAKILSYLKARVRSMSEDKGYRGEVISAMMDLQSELTIDEIEIKKEGELLSLTAKEAVKEYGDPPAPLLGAGIRANLDELLDGLHGSGNYQITRIEVTWSERVAQYLTAIAPVLMGLGMVLLFIEFKTPGFGFFGIAGGVLLAVVFFGHFIAGLSGHEPVLFFLLGVALIAVELIFFPGTLIAGLVGVVLMLGSLVWSMTDLWPAEPIAFSADLFLQPLLNVTLGVALAVAVFLAIFKFLPQGGLWGKLVLDTAVRGEPGKSDGPAASSFSLIGATGVSVTALYPSGQIEIDGRRYEARLAIGHAGPGTPVRVVSRGEFDLIVEVLS